MAMQGSASAPTLPPVPPEVRAAQQRGLREAAKRKEFLGGFINQDLGHGRHHFLGPVDGRYNCNCRYNDMYMYMLYV